MMNGEIRERVVLRPEYSDMGPWGVFDTYCLRCSNRTVTVGSVHDERFSLWWCPDCEAWTVTHHPYEDDE